MNGKRSKYVDNEDKDAFNKLANASNGFFDAMKTAVSAATLASKPDVNITMNGRDYGLYGGTTKYGQFSKDNLLKLFKDKGWLKQGDYLKFDWSETAIGGQKH